MLSCPILASGGGAEVLHPGRTANMPRPRPNSVPLWLRRLLKWMGLAVMWSVLSMLALFCFLMLSVFVMDISDSGGWTRKLPEGWERVHEVRTVDELAAAMLPCKDLRHRMQIVYERGNARVLHTWTAQEWAGTWTLTCTEDADAPGEVRSPRIVYEDVAWRLYDMDMAALEQGDVSLIWRLSDRE